MSLKSDAIMPSSILVISTVPSKLSNALISSARIDRALESNLKADAGNEVSHTCRKDVVLSAKKDTTGGYVEVGYVNAVGCSEGASLGTYEGILDGAKLGL